jgi:hypothetical protein|tara:strand:- start:48 stop:425 length:378 start_codon:yes stop_codon:yes gene_type:complete
MYICATKYEFSNAIFSFSSGRFGHPTLSHNRDISFTSKRRRVENSIFFPLFFDRTMTTSGSSLSFHVASPVEHDVDVDDVRGLCGARKQQQFFCRLKGPFIASSEHERLLRLLRRRWDDDDDDAR